MFANELLQAKAGAPDCAQEAPVGLCHRVLNCALRAIGKRDGQDAILETPRVRGLLQDLGVLHVDQQPASTNDVLTRLDELVAAQDMACPDGLGTIAELAAELAQVFGYGMAEQRLLELALHANRSRLVQRAMNVIGEVDDEEAAQLFADILGLERDAITAGLRRPSPFRKIRPFDVIHGHGMPFIFLKFSGAAANVARNSPRLDSMLSLFCRPAPKARLAMDDFHYHSGEIAVLRRYLQRALSEGRAAVNILLHGAPGTGKTELVRTLTESLGGKLVEVPTVDEDKDPLPPWRRLTALTATQEVMRQQPTALVLFDEVEDVFPHDGLTFGGNPARPSSDRLKGWLTQLLEENPRPTFWVCNEISHIDLAYIRRFDMVIELHAPGRAAREAIVDNMFAGIDLDEGALDGMKSEAKLAPAHLARIAGVLRTMAPESAEDAEAVLITLETQTRKALGLPVRTRQAAVGIPYRHDCINTSVDLVAVAAALSSQPAARICLYGAPGTGKTEWARQLARSLDLPLHVKRASDLLSKFVGGSERLIRQAFEAAIDERAVLLIDEADGLLRERTSANHGWEVSMTNELLTSMESFDGIFVASTNLQDRLDRASARRFDFKIEFDYLMEAQVSLLFSDLVKALGGVFAGEGPSKLRELTMTTPGDFSNVLRQARLLGGEATADHLVELLLREQAGRRDGGSPRRVGFV